MVAAWRKSLANRVSKEDADQSEANQAASQAGQAEGQKRKEVVTRMMEQVSGHKPTAHAESTDMESLEGSVADSNSPNARGLVKRERHTLESTNAEKEQRSADNTHHIRSMEQRSAADTTACTHMCMQT